MEWKYQLLREYKEIGASNDERSVAQKLAIKTELARLGLSVTGKSKRRY